MGTTETTTEMVVIDADGENGPPRVAVTCYMCKGECAEFGTWCGVCLGDGVIYRSASSPVARFDEQEYISKATRLMVDAMALVAERTWGLELEARSRKTTPMVWTIDDAIVSVFEEQVNMDETDLGGLLWALGQAVKGLMHQKDKARKAEIEAVIKKLRLGDTSKMAPAVENVLFLMEHGRESFDELLSLMEAAVRDGNEAPCHEFLQGPNAQTVINSLAPERSERLDEYFAKMQAEKDDAELLMAKAS